MAVNSDGSLGTGGLGAKYQEKGKDKEVSPPICCMARVPNTHLPGSSSPVGGDSAAGTKDAPIGVWSDPGAGEGAADGQYQGAEDGSDFESGEQGMSCNRGETSQAQDGYNTAKKAQDEGLYGYKTHGRDVEVSSATHPDADALASAANLVTSEDEAVAPALIAGVAAQEAMDAAGSSGGGEDGSEEDTPSNLQQQKDAVAGQPHGAAINAAAARNGVQPGLAAGLVRQESNFNQAARSNRGAIGLTQLMPGTARGLGVNPYSVTGNLNGGMRYLKSQIDKFGVAGGLAAYNGGPTRFENRGRDISKMPGETQAFVGKVLGYASGFGFDPSGAGGGGTPATKGGGAGSYPGRISKYEAAGRALQQAHPGASNAETAGMSSNGITPAEAAEWGRAMAAKHGGKDMNWLVKNGYPMFEQIISKLGNLASGYKTPIDLAKLWKNQFFRPYPSLGSVPFKALKAGGGSGQGIQEIIDGAKSKLEEALEGLGESIAGDIAIFESDIFKNEVIKPPIDEVAKTDLVQWHPPETADSGDGEPVEEGDG